ncbi:MAG TPA: flagellar protein FlbD [Verrucomicrobia bacterium]|nr:flagellar protein FlbD [Verrucomicrobiota bacterium]
MITCSDLHGRISYINPDLLIGIEITPDTQLVFVNGHRLFVSETPEEIVERIVEFRIRTGLGARPPAWISENELTDNGKD